MLIKEKSFVCCKWSSSLGSLECGESAKTIWGTEDYVYKRDKNNSCVFFGMYSLRDYLALIRHKGLKFILWAGSDIKNLINGFYLNDGKLKWLSQLVPFSNRWLIFFLKKNCIHYVENQTEGMALNLLGIKSTIKPSFLGNVKDYEVSFKPSKNPHVYLSCSGSRQSEYGFDFIEYFASRFSFITFHFYGAPWETKQKNIIVHGKIPKEQMNKEIKNMQGSLRLNSFDGFSEITAKSILWGQYPLTVVKHRKISHFLDMEDLGDFLHDLRNRRKPNLEAREWYIKNLNDYPWNIKKY